MGGIMGERIFDLTAVCVFGKVVACGIGCTYGG